MTVFLIEAVLEEARKITKMGYGRIRFTRRKAYTPKRSRKEVAEERKLELWEGQN